MQHSKCGTLLRTVLLEVKSSSYSLPGNSKAAFADLPKAALLTSDPFPQGFNYFSAIPPPLRLVQAPLFLKVKAHMESYSSSGYCFVSSSVY